MSDVEYSREAVNVLSKFHRCERLIYVEGDDDVLFWDTLFQYFKFSNFKIEVKDGSCELDKYADRIISEDLNIIVARDSDYKVLTENLPKHERIITTYGYSIENTLFIAESVVEITKLWIKDNNFPNSNYDEWINDFSSHLKELIYFDVANDCYDLYLDVIGDNCTRYMKTQSCSNIDLIKINKHKNKLKPCFCDEQVSQVSDLINKSDRELWEIIRGHFLQSAILKFISSHVDKKGLRFNMSHDALYTNAIQQLKNTFNDDHKHFEFYFQSITPLIQVA